DIAQPIIITAKIGRRWAYSHSAGGLTSRRAGTSVGVGIVLALVAQVLVVVVGVGRAQRGVRAELGQGPAAGDDRGPPQRLQPRALAGRLVVAVVVEDLARL